MSEDLPYVLATACAAPDLEYPSLRALGAAICLMRDVLDPDHQRELVLTPSMVSRGDLPGGACVAVRARRDGEPGRGEFIGYALIPGTEHGPHAAKLLMTAILAVAQPELA